MLCGSARPSEVIIGDPPLDLAFVYSCLLIIFPSFCFCNPIVKYSVSLDVVLSVNYHAPYGLVEQISNIGDFLKKCHATFLFFLSDN